MSNLALNDNMNDSDIMEINDDTRGLNYDENFAVRKRTH